MAEELEIIASSEDWYVDAAPIIDWGYNANGTFTIRIERVSIHGTVFPWTMNVPSLKLGTIPQVLDSLTPEQRQRVRFRGGWQGNNATAIIGLKPVK